jgi:hypothetical protein
VVMGYASFLLSVGSIWRVLLRRPLILLGGLTWAYRAHLPEGLKRA